MSNHQRADRAEPIAPSRVQAAMAAKQDQGWNWQIWAFLFVAAGMFATAAYAIVETYWG